MPVNRHVQPFAVPVRLAGPCASRNAAVSVIISDMTIDMNALARAGAQVRISELIGEIESLVQAFPGLGKAPARTARITEFEEAAPRKRRKMSAATKAKLRASWAKRRAGKSVQLAAEPTPEAATEASAKKRTMSAEGKARIAAAQKKRWAAVRKAKKR